MSYDWYKPHPLGILPGGGRIDEDGTRSSISCTFSDGALGRLVPTVTLIEEIISFLPPYTLCRLSRCSWRWYAVCNSEELWKLVFIAAANCRPSADDDDDDASDDAETAAWKTLVRNVSNFRPAEHHSLFSHNWKTFLVRNSISGNNNGGVDAKSSYIFIPRAPSRRLSQLCSDRHFSSHLATIMPPDFTGVYGKTSSNNFNFRRMSNNNNNASKQQPSLLNTPPRRDARIFSLDQFRNEFEIPNVPCILTHACDEWPIYKILDGKFANIRDRADDIFRDKNFRMRCESVVMNAMEYVAYAEAQHDERPIYMFDSEFEKRSLKPNLWATPSYFARDDLFSVLGQGGRPDHRWLICGPANAGSSFHTDPNLTAAYNSCLTGRKRWIMMPAGKWPPGVWCSEDMSTVVTPASITEWFLQFYDALVAQNTGAGMTQDTCPVYDFVCEAGETVFVPSGWPHCVINLEPSIAITENYVCEPTLHDVLRFIRVMRKSISGIGEDDAQEEGEEGGQQQQQCAPAAAASTSSCAMSSGCGMTMQQRRPGMESIASKQANFLPTFQAALRQQRPDLAPIVDAEAKEAAELAEAARVKRVQRMEFQAALRLDDNTNKNSNSGDAKDDVNDRGGGGFKFSFM